MPMRGEKMPQKKQSYPKYLGFRVISMLALSLLSSCGIEQLDQLQKTTNISGTLTLPIPGFSQSSTPNFQPHSSAKTAKMQANTQAKIIPGEYIVTTPQGITAQALTSLNVNGTTLQRTSGIPELGIWFYKANKNQISSQSSSQMLNQLQALPGILSAEHNTEFKLYQKPNDEFYFLQWHFQEMNIPRAWNFTTGAKVRVAVVDTGIVSHPDLNRNILSGADTISDSQKSLDGDGRDLNPADIEKNSGHHGTHVAGTIAAVVNNGIGLAGVSWGTKVVPVRAITSKGGNTKDIIAGVAWAAGYKVDQLGTTPHPAKIINLSLGSKRPCSPAEQTLFHMLAQKGIVAVVAAGNDGANVKDYSPASCNNVITVGATVPGGARASYSNYGSQIDIMAPGGDNTMKVEINDQPYAAGVYSTILDSKGKPSYGIQQGTSMAAPHISGAIALMLGERPNMSFNEIRTRLQLAGQPLGDQCGVPNGCGAGLLNVGQLIEDLDKPVPQKRTDEYPIYIGAFYETQPLKYDMERSAIKKLTSSSYQIPYKLNNIKPGNYRMIAYVDTNKNNTYEQGEPYGLYEDLVHLPGKEKDFANVSFRIHHHHNSPQFQSHKIAQLFNRRRSEFTDE